MIIQVPMQPMSMENLEKLLEKATKEEGISDQPLYIDELEKVIKYQWCGDQFKGSVQLKHINQHVKKAAFHCQRRREVTDKGAKQRDIRKFFCT